MRARLLILTALLAAPARSQDSKDPAWGDLPLAEVRRIQHRFADCVVKRRPLDAERFVLSIGVDPKTFSRLVDRVSDGDCLRRNVRAIATVKMRFPTATMHYALADALVRAQLSQPAISDFERVAPLFHVSVDPDLFAPAPGKKLKATELQKLAAKRADAEMATYASRFGECVVRVDPLAAHRLLMTVPETADEKSAFTAVTSAMANCVPEGRTMALNKMTVRGTVALNYYRLARAPRLIREPA